jgi:phosphopantothenoylcysteine decarboxylase/phosphopantothenate--cysteine ligase|tara:strand:- start:9601 stop:10863 length:1263 start_codon:yes stop_codon:yes gene_type:complete
MVIAMTEISLFKNINVVLGVTGGIAAYKVVDLTSRLVKAGAIVDVIMTEAATKFVGPITFQALTHRPVVTEMFSLLQETEIGHVSLGKQANIMIVAPATANTLAKLAHGLSDNMLTTTALACRGPILLAPAMETGMWKNSATQTNSALLQERGMHIIGPGVGRLASGADGLGRMAESDEIFEACRWVLGRNGTLAGCQVVVTAGGTWEPFDPVRFIGNRSSGKMGFALANIARDRGGDVTLIHAPTALSPTYGVQSIPVETALQMHDAVMDKISATDVLLMAAAVADYRPALLAEQKIKKSEGSRFVELVRNPDILQAVANWRETNNRPRLVVGFAAETEDLLENARNKLAKKRLDLMVANDVSATDSGFAVDTNKVTLLDTKEEVTPLPLLSKNEVAERIIDTVGAMLKQKDKMGKSRE